MKVKDRNMKTFLATIILVGAIAADAAAPPLLDDFSDSKTNKLGGSRLLFDDKSAGSQSRATRRCSNGVMTVKGELVPGRGVPAFISVASPLSVDGKPRDLTGYTGIRLRVKVTKGILSVQVTSSDVTNFDFHSSAPVTGKPGVFHEVRIAFKDLKRAWSPQTALNLKSATGVNLVSFGMEKGAFAYEVDELGFY